MKTFAKITLLLSMIGITITVVFPEITQAQVQIDPQLKPEYAASITPQGGNRASGFNIILQLIAGGLIYAAGPIAVLMLAVGGIRYIVAHGEPGQIDEAKKMITYALIGLGVIIVSFAIVTNVIKVISTIGITGSENITMEYDRKPEPSNNNSGSVSSGSNSGLDEDRK